MERLHQTVCHGPYTLTPTIIGRIYPVMRKSVLVNDGGDGMGSFHLLMEREPPTSLESIARFSLRVQREGEDVFMQTSDGVSNGDQVRDKLVKEVC